MTHPRMAVLVAATTLTSAIVAMSARTRLVASPTRQTFREYRPYDEFKDYKRAEPVPIKVNPKPVASDPSIKYDYDIVFVRAPRLGDDRQTSWPDVFLPNKVEPGADLMVLHPDGREEMLVKAGPQQAVTDPFVSFDAQWVFYALFDGIERRPSGQALAASSDIYKVNVRTKQSVRLTHQEYTPNTGIAAADKPRRVFNLGPCPIPGGGVIFTSDRNGFVATKNYQTFAVYKDDYEPARSLQLFRMNDDGSNVENLGHLNINTALHPTILRDGRVMFSSFENEGLRDTRDWGVWTIHPDGTHWQPLYSALGASSEEARHFFTQLSDGHIIVEHYYFQHNMGFGSYFKMAERAPEGEPYFGSAYRDDPRNLVMAPKLHPVTGREGFSPLGLEEITRFSHFLNSAAYLSDPADKNSPRVGKVTQPSGAPDNHLLTVYSTGPTYGVALKDRYHEFTPPAIHSGIYMIKRGEAIDEPAQLLQIRTEPNYNLQWPRALVPYKRIYGVDEPAVLMPAPYDTHLAKELPAGVPYGMVGSASLYKRETYPGGLVPSGEVTARFGGWPKEDPYQYLGGPGHSSRNWGMQGADAGKYDNADIHAIRIIATEPTTDPRSTPAGVRRWWNAANERFRILGEFPVRKFDGETQPVDPDGNPDTSFLAKLPADIAWTLQTLDKNGMVLNMAQTWHQLRPGEVRTDCGGCHAHSQKPTPWAPTAAAQASYRVFDLTRETPLLTSKPLDESKRKWDVKDETGLRFAKTVQDVEFYRDVKPILDRSCTACHTQKWPNPAGHLVLDDMHMMKRASGVTAGQADAPSVPGTFVRLAMDPTGEFSYPSPPLGFGQASRYLRFFQSRRSLLAWKIYGRRLDGFSNDDFAYETVPGDPASLQYRGQAVTRPKLPPGVGFLPAIDIGYTGTIMPPPDAVAGTFKAPDGSLIKVPALTDEQRRTIVRWIDLGAPIDLDYDPARPRRRGRGWLADDNRPTLVLTEPAPGVNRTVTRVLVGMHDFESGLDMASFSVVADVDIAGATAGTNLAPKFKQQSAGVWALVLAKPLFVRGSRHLTVSVKDRQGNVTRIDRTFTVTSALAKLANQSK
jgi:hypothetical protein